MATPTTLPATFVAGNVLTAAQMNNLRGAFRILQVVQTTKLDDFDTSSTTYVDVTGLSVSITPSATSNLVLVFADVKFSGTTAVGSSPTIQIVRGSTAIYIGNTAGSRARATAGYNSETAPTDRIIMSSGSLFLDSPATTSATTYKIQMRAGTGGSGRVNKNGVDADNAAFPRTASSITVMEISA